MLTHIDENNNPAMVDIKGKSKSERIAVAEGFITLPKELMEHLSQGEIKVKKGPVFATAIIAGTMAVKRSSDLIPFCHPIPLDSCKFDITVAGDNRVHIICRVKCFHHTGIEMEALTGVSVASLTIYDMCMAMSHEIEISEIRLVKKSGGKADYER